MNNRFTSLARPFPTTRWSLVQSARADDSVARSALEEFCRKYWRPIYSFARHRGLTSHDAEDITQAFLAQILENGNLEKAEEAKGRFRTFLICQFRGFLSNHRQKQNAAKRGGTSSHLSLDIEWAESRLELADPRFSDPEVYFDRQWALDLVRHARAALSARYHSRGKGDLFEALKSGLAETPDASRYEQWEEELGMSAGSLRVALHRLRDRFRKEIEEQILDTVCDEKDLVEEMRHLRKALSQTKGGE